MKAPSHAQLEAQFNRVKISARDFEEAIDYLNALRGKRVMSVRRALLLAAIVAYCRPFTTNDKPPSNKAVSQLPINIEKELNTKENELHSKIVIIRNKALAHSEYSHKPTKRIRATKTGFSTWSKPYDVLSEEIDINEFAGMCRKLNEYCIFKMFDLNKLLGPKS